MCPTCIKGKEILSLFLLRCLTCTNSWKILFLFHKHYRFPKPVSLLKALHILAKSLCLFRWCSFFPPNTIFSHFIQRKMVELHNYTRFAGTVEFACFTAMLHLMTAQRSGTIPQEKGRRETYPTCSLLFAMLPQRLGALGECVSKASSPGGPQGWWWCSCTSPPELLQRWAFLHLATTLATGRVRNIFPDPQYWWSRDCIKLKGCWQILVLLYVLFFCLK